MADKLKVSDVIPASPERVYTAWLDAGLHAAMTGAGATDEGEGRFTAWDGYITGRTVSASPYHQVVQRWRTSEFPSGAPDSRLTVTFVADPAGTKVTLSHTGIPQGQGASYEAGWREYYFTPMKRHFDSPLEQVREVAARVARAVDEVREEALEAVQAARGKARRQAVTAVKSGKKARGGKAARAPRRRQARTARKAPTKRAPRPPRAPKRRR